VASIAIEGFRLSPQQKHLWTLRQDGSGQSYRVQAAILIEGNLDSKLLKEAVQRVVSRNEILRTVFHRRPGMKTPFQIVSDQATWSWQEVDHSGLSAPEQVEAGELLFQQEIAQPFDFEAGPLLRTRLITQLPDRHILIVSLPAVCADSLSIKNFMQEMSNAYAACLNGEELSADQLQYVDYCEWNNELLETEDESAEQGRAFWQRPELSSSPAPKLPFEIRPNQSSTSGPHVFSFGFEPAVLARIQEISEKENVSASIYLFACWQTLLWRLTGQSDVVVGNICDGRKYQEFQEALGPFSRCVPIHCSFQAEIQFDEILSQMQRSISEASEWQEYFTWEETGDASGPILSLPIGFEFQDRPARYAVAGLSFSLNRQYSWTESFKIKLSCVRLNGLLKTELHYDPSVFQAESIQRLAGYLNELLKSTTEDRGTPVGDLNVLTEAERHQLLIEFNQTAADYPREKCIHELFEEQVARTPNAIAVICGDQQLSYAELNARSNQLAHHLRRSGVSPDVPVGLCVERSVQMVVGLLGILKAGGAYVPLNPEHPKTRLAHELLEIQSPVLVTQKDLMNSLPAFSGETIYLDSGQAPFEQESTINPERTADPQNLVYVIYTSGSTGAPKGVGISHQSLVNYTDFMSGRLRLREQSNANRLNFAIVSTVSADLGNTCIFPALTSGGCLHVISYEVATEGSLFSDYVSKHSIDVLKIVPSHLRALLGSQEDGDILPRKWLILGGEALSRELTEQVSQRSKGCKILNHYGPTETTVGSLTFSSEEQGHAARLSLTVPIGRPIANTQVYILDRSLNPVPVGVSGELFIGGDGLARGYLNQPEQTAERFVSNPFSNDRKSRLYRTGDLARFLPQGDVEFLGRVDHQVKIRGFRVELGEVESVLSKYPSIRESVVVAREDTPGDMRLVAYVVARESVPDIAELRGQLKDELPDYMVPSAFVMLKMIPLTPNGKVDRNALPAPDHGDLALERVFVAPQTPTEEVVAGVWAEVLRSGHIIGIHDNFFDLGGHSLLVTQVVARLRKAFQVEIPLRWLFESPTVAELAERIGRTDQQQTSLMLNELEYLTDEEAQRLLDLERRHG
jgi:amino acid adenylation domain-containing protein